MSVLRGARGARMLTTALHRYGGTQAARVTSRRHHEVESSIFTGRRFMTVSSDTTKDSETNALYKKSTGGTVQDILDFKGSSFFKCRKDDTVYCAIQEMVRHNIGSLVVVEAHKKVGYWKPIGIVTERDYMEKGIVVGRSSKETYVGEIMSTKGLISVKPNANLQQCMELMTDNHIRHVPVVEADDRLVGMISVGDVMKELVKEQKKEVEEMTDFVSGMY